MSIATDKMNLNSTILTAEAKPLDLMIKELKDLIGGPNPTTADMATLMGFLLKINSQQIGSLKQVQRGATTLTYNNSKLWHEQQIKLSTAVVPSKCIVSLYGIPFMSSDAGQNGVLVQSLTTTHLTIRTGMYSNKTDGTNDISWEIAEFY